MLPIGKGISDFQFSLFDSNNSIIIEGFYDILLLKISNDWFEFNL